MKSAVLEIPKSTKISHPMIIPIRCFTCNKEISSKYELYVAMRRNGKEARHALDELGITHICCRRMFLTHVDIGDQLLEFVKTENVEL